MQLTERHAHELVAPCRRRRSNGSLRPLQRVRFCTYHDDAPREHRPHSECEGKLIAVEWHEHEGEWHPHSVRTTTGEYDCFYCKRDETVYFHASGFGGRDDRHELHGFCEPIPRPGRFWLAPGVRPVRRSGQGSHWSEPCYYLGVRRVTWQAMGYERVEGPIGHPLEFACEGRCQWCETCEDWLPEENLCEHLVMCWNCQSVYVAEGDEERRCPDCSKSQCECGDCWADGAEICISCGRWICETCWRDHLDEEDEPCERGASDWKEP